jgi:hypothetical protein
VYQVLGLRVPQNAGSLVDEPLLASQDGLKFMKFVMTSYYDGGERYRKHMVDEKYKTIFVKIKLRETYCFETET